MSENVLVNQDATGCPETFKDLMEEFIKCFDISHQLNDIFLYGVFMSADTYVSFDWNSETDYGFEIPPILKDSSVKYNTLIAFVESEMVKAMKEKKPEWMLYVEENATCANLDIEPSTYLKIHPLKPEYNRLATLLDTFMNSIQYRLYEI